METNADPIAELEAAILEYFGITVDECTWGWSDADLAKVTIEVNRLEHRVHRFRIGPIGMDAARQECNKLHSLLYGYETHLYVVLGFYKFHKWGFCEYSPLKDPKPVSPIINRLFNIVVSRFDENQKALARAQDAKITNPSKVGTRHAVVEWSSRLCGSARGYAVGDRSQAWFFVERLGGDEQSPKSTSRLSRTDDSAAGAHR